MESPFLTSSFAGSFDFLLHNKNWQCTDALPDFIISSEEVIDQGRSERTTVESH
jgi:hypothetical protein